MLGGLNAHILSHSVYVLYTMNLTTYILVTCSAREYHRMVWPLALHGLTARVFRFVSTYRIRNITVLRLGYIPYDTLVTQERYLSLSSICGSVALTY